MKTGIFFGGLSREREVSFRSGCSVYNSIDRSLFEPVPVFVDSFGNFVLLHKNLMQAEAIRAFYPPPALYASENSRFELGAEAFAAAGSEEAEKMLAEIGQKISPDQFSTLFDAAIIALHGPYGEDGNLQGILEWYDIPYTGSGVFGSALGIDKILQNRLLRQVTGQKKADAVLSFSDWNRRKKAVIFEELRQKIGLPMVIKAPHQGSSVGIRILKNNDSAEFVTKVNDCFFTAYISRSDWAGLSEAGRLKHFSDLISLENGIGMPMVFETETGGAEEFSHPERLFEKLNAHFAGSDETVKLSSAEHETQLLVEEFIEGREFTCAVLQDENGRAVALAPTEVIKDEEQEFDFAAKYTPGLVVEQILMDAPAEDLERIRKACAHAFTEMSLNVYARIDGFLTEKGAVFLHDPNTVPGMTAQSFIFRQMAEMGFSPGNTFDFFAARFFGRTIENREKQPAIARSYPKNRRIHCLGFGAEKEFGKGNRAFRRNTGNGSFFGSSQKKIQPGYGRSSNRSTSRFNLRNGTKA